MERDRALVEQCLNGSDGAWEELVRSHSGLVYSSCYRFTGRSEEARDLTQEVFLRVFRSLHTYNPTAGAFRTWLVRLTRNLLIDNYRKTKKDQVLDALDDEAYHLEQTTGVASRADSLLRGREAGEMLQKALSKLSPELREAVILRDLQDLEYREIGEALDIPEGTVKSRINRGRRELARRLRAMGAAS
jgi:RNA polymerase sigma-70 factor (ECF subfamily)